MHLHHFASPVSIKTAFTHEFVSLIVFIVPSVFSRLKQTRRVSISTHAQTFLASLVFSSFNFF